MFDYVGNFTHTVGREFVPDMAIEDHWLNCQDDYEVRVNNYCQMDLKLVEEVLKVPLSLKIID